jgi:hypothetical protein
MFGVGSQAAPHVPGYNNAPMLATNGPDDRGWVLLLAIVQTAVWTAYVLKSKRVAATFTK